MKRISGGKGITVKDFVKRYGSEAVFGLLLLGMMVMYLSRINMGMADMDESFYLTIPFRMTQGDALLVDEWHVSQLAGFLTYPLVKLYLVVAGGTDGIVLAFRYIYLAVQMLVTVAGYLLLRRRDKWMALAVSLVYGLFTPFGIKALSYNTMGLMATYLFVTLGLSEWKRKWLQYTLMGLALAAAVLCNPYMVVLYGGIVFVTALTQGLGGLGVGDVLTWKKVLFLTIGAGVLFLLFMGFELSRVSVSQMLDSLQFVTGDSAHQSKDLSGIFRAFTYYPRTYPHYFRCWAICTVIGLVFKKLSKVSFGVITVFSIALTLYFAWYKTNGIGYSAIMVPLSFTGLAAFLFTRKRRWSLLFGGWLIGFIYSLCMSASSNNGIYTYANASTVAACVGVMMIWDFVKESLGMGSSVTAETASAKSVASGTVPGKNEAPDAVAAKSVASGTGTVKTAGSASWGSEVIKLLPCCGLILLLGTQLYAESHILLNHIFWESGPEALTTEIGEGPLAGLRTTAAKANRYRLNYENALELKKLEGEHVLFYCRFPSGYLILDDWANGANSAWLADSIEDLNDPRMDEYYERHPEKVPDVIYIDTQSVSVWSDEQWESYCEEHGYRLERFETGGYALIRE